MDTINMLGVYVSKINMENAVNKACEFMETDGVSTIYTPNSEIILYASNNPEYTNVLNSADMIIADGIGVVYGAKILGDKLEERVAGYDLVVNLFDKMAKNKKSVYLLGAKPGIAEVAAENIKDKYPGIKIAGTHDGYFKDEDDERVIAEINATNPDFLMVCVGFPRQENWIHKHKDKLNTKLAIGAGGCIDVFAGNVQRAPEFYCKHGLEWFYRLVKQPSRFIRMLALPKFGLKVLFKGKKYQKKEK